MNLNYNPEEGGYLQQLYKATRPAPRQLDERQLKSKRNQAALTDVLGLLAQFVAAAGGGDVRERQFSQTATGQASVQEKNLREYYRKLQDDYDKGLLSAVEKDYDQGFRSALQNQRFIQQLTNSDINNRARMQNSQFVQDRTDRRTEYQTQNANARLEYQTQNANNRLEYQTQNANARAEAQLKFQIDKFNIEQKNRIAVEQYRQQSQNARENERQINQNRRTVQRATVAGATPQRAIQDNVANMQAFEAHLKQLLPSVVITSRHRPGATTATGNVSRHAMPGGAIDISPTQDKDGKIRAFFNSDQGKILMFMYGLGFLDETLPENKKYGNSYHIGTDTALVNANNEWVKAHYPDVYLESIPQSQRTGTGTGTGAGTRSTGTATGTRAGSSTGSTNPYRTIMIPSNANAEGARKDTRSNEYYVPFDFATREEYDMTVKTAQAALKDEKFREELISEGLIKWGDTSFTDQKAVELYLSQTNKASLYPVGGSWQPVGDGIIYQPQPGSAGAPAPAATQPPQSTPAQQPATTQPQQQNRTVINKPREDILMDDSDVEYFKKELGRKFTDNERKQYAEKAERLKYMSKEDAWNEIKKDKSFFDKFYGPDALKDVKDSNITSMTSYYIACCELFSKPEEQWIPNNAQQATPATPTQQPAQQQPAANPEDDKEFADVYREIWAWLISDEETNEAYRRFIENGRKIDRNLLKSHREVVQARIDAQARGATTQEIRNIKPVDAYAKEATTEDIKNLKSQTPEQVLYQALRDQNFLDSAPQYKKKRGESAAQHDLRLKPLAAEIAQKYIEWYEKGETEEDEFADLLIQ